MYFPRFCLWIVLALGVVAPASADAQAGTQRSVPAASERFDVRFDTLRRQVTSDPQAVLAASRALERSIDPAAPSATHDTVRARWLQAEAHVRINEPDAALRRIASALTLLARTPGRYPVEGDLIRTRGGIAADKADVATALSDYQAAYRAYFVTGDRRGQALALMSIASLYREGADFQTSLRYYGQAIDSYNADPALRVSLFNNRGNVLAEMQLYARARADFKQALALVRATGNRPFEALIWSNLARAQVAGGATDDAARSIAAGIAVARQSDPRIIREMLQSLAARIAAEQNNPAKALRLIEPVFAGVDLRTTTLASRDNHRNAYAVYSAVGDRGKALAHLEALTRLDEQATQVAMSAKTALMSARFDFQNQELRIARLRQDELRRNVAFERSSARSQRLLFLGIAAAVAVLVLLLTGGLLTIRSSRNKVRHANIELGTTNVALEKALRAKTEFLATTSHEIRTPLNGILGMTQVMLSDRRLAPDFRERLGIVQDAGVAMRSLVDDILDLAKMETGNLTVDCQPTELPALLTGVAGMWQAQAQDRGIAFAIDIVDAPPWIDSDPARLRQIVFNLLSNALKFTHAGVIELRVRTAGDRLRIAVHDTGIGIPQDKHDAVFESFRQADTSTTRQFGGTGLGLTICRNLARALGGDILLESTPGVGSVFTLDLPLVRVAAPRGSIAPCDGTGRCELVILDRNPIARSMMRTLFAERVATLAFVDDVAALLARIEVGEVANALIVGEMLCGVPDLPPPVALARIAAALDRAGGRGVVLATLDQDGLGDVVDASATLTLVRKPVSGPKLSEALFGPPGATGHAASVLVSAGG